VILLTTVSLSCHVKHGYKRDTGSILPETGPQNGMIFRFDAWLGK
jgi:hypothetical protein